MEKLIILDRDGIINKLLINSLGEIDSPMELDQIEVYPWVNDCISFLSTLDYNFAIATNQPAAAKNKISYEKLKEIHDNIVSNLTIKPNSFICWHKSQDNCNCRKPKTGLLEQIYEKYNFDKSNSWMVGDRYTDIITGNSFGVNTALLSNYSEKELAELNKINIAPNYCGDDLRDFVRYISII